MKIYNEEKTKELTNPDLEKGFLFEDKRLIKHHDAVPEKIIKTVEQVKAELEAQGKEITQGTSGNWYFTKKYFPATKDRPEGRIAEEITPLVEPSKEAWDEYEDIQVYHPYTEEEYVEYLRAEREAICFPVINRGAAWYARLTEEQKEELQEWYQTWLDAPQTGVKPETPAWI